MKTDKLSSVNLFSVVVSVVVISVVSLGQFSHFTEERVIVRHFIYFWTVRLSSEMIYLLFLRVV